MRFHVEAVLFDIDGTLVDSTGAVVRTWRTWAAQHDIDAEAILSVCHGRRTEDTVAQFVAGDQQAAATAELEELERADLSDVNALPSAGTLLWNLPAERWAAVTSGSRALMQSRLTAAGLPVPDVLVAADDVSAGKPDPEGYRKAAAALGHEITRCLIVEDAPAGIEAGRAAGASTLAVATTHRAEELSSAEAVIPDLSHCVLEPAAKGITLFVDA